MFVKPHEARWCTQMINAILKGPSVSDSEQQFAVGAYTAECICTAALIGEQMSQLLTQ